MATRIYSIDKGAQITTITEGIGAATTLGMELTIDLAKFSSRTEAILALENLTQYIVKDGWAPA